MLRKYIFIVISLQKNYSSREKIRVGNNKTHPKKPKKTTQKNPLKMGFWGF
jgi:hypothetical protein